MTTLPEGKLSFVFPSDWTATKYDNWIFYRNRFQDRCCGNKAVDFLALDPSRTLWLIEVKDYREHRRTKDEKILLWDEVAIKARDTLAGLFAAKVDSSHDADDHAFAKSAVKATKLRVVLHLEQPARHSKLFPRIFDGAKLQQKLKQLLKPIDAHPKVAEMADMGTLAWTTLSTSGEAT